MSLTIRQAQTGQPWTVPYAFGVTEAQRRIAENGGVPHILATHCVLHAAKSVGKLAAVFEALDHPDPDRREVWPGQPCQIGPNNPTPAQLETIRAMSADLMTAALRFANLYSFDLEAALIERVREKNGVAL